MYVYKLFFKKKRFRIGVCDYCLNCVATIAVTGINAWHDGDWMKEVFFYKGQASGEVELLLLYKVNQ